jgi:glycosyltransferase involved in cell wall biosynthesis
MKILIYTTAFPPQVGGLETIARITAEGLARLGHGVTVCCKTVGHHDAAYRILRNASTREVLAASSAADVFFMFNMNLKALHLPVLARKPLVICHHGWYGENYGDKSWRIWLKKKLSLLLATNTACSAAVATYLGDHQVTVVPNAYDADTFVRMPDVPRTQDLLFVGRLVSTKGVALLLEALAELGAREVRPRLTVVGEGPEGTALRHQADRLGLDAQVCFVGSVSGVPLARLMNAHRVLVAPSLPAEPFGIVALEGAACGCFVVGSDQGGLQEAIGPCGAVFPNGNREALAAALEAALRRPQPDEAEERSRQEHLARHQPERVVAAYEQVLKAAAAQSH